MKNITLFFVILSSFILFCSVTITSKKEETTPFFSTDIALTDKGEILLTQKGLQRLDLFSSDGKTLLNSYPLNEIPTGVVFHNGKAYVTTFSTQGQLQVVNLESGQIEGAVLTGSGACFPLISPDEKHIYVCNQFANSVVEVELQSMKVTRRVEVPREPVSAVTTNDGRYMYVVNYLPAQRADLNYVGGCVSVIDLQSFKKIKDISLSNGSNALRGITITPDNKYVYVAHNLGRYTVPTSQLQQGWMNTSAFSVINVEAQAFVGSVVTDEPERGAAGIWNIACNEKTIYILHSGTHEVSVIEHQAMRDKLEKYPNKELLDYDLNFLYDIRKRITLEGNGPRSLVLTNEKLYIPTYFADVLNVFDVQTLANQVIDMNPGRVESAIHKGEKIFNDATHCFQNWQSCNGCHPGDARMDAMNWDLMNDGVGNSKNCKSLLFSHVTPPCMISGIRASAELAVDAGFRFIQFFELDRQSLDCVDEYLKALEPISSPYLVEGALSEKAKEGRKVFDKLKCGECHSGPYYTDMKTHRIGEDIEFEQGWDTPTLREVWRTAPYLFDGRAATMKDVFEVHKHGIEKKTSAKEIEALTEYVNSL